MKKFLIVLFIKLLFLSAAGISSAFFIDFEDGRNGARINNIEGVSFKNFSGYDAMYGDSRTGSYHTHSDDRGLSYNDAYFHHNGNFWLWAGADADARGVIVDFTNNNGTWFKTGYSTYGDFIMEAHLTNGRTVTASGATNTEKPMSFLTVKATSGSYIDYVVLKGMEGNVWLVDDMSGNTTGINSEPPPTPTPAEPPPPPVPAPGSDDDGDGMPYAWEVDNGLNPSVNDASSDPDRDGLSNIREYQNGTNPKNADTDSDGMPDKWEVDNRLNPKKASDASSDTDRDGLTNLDEYKKGTAPRTADTDNDGMPDGWEVTNSLNPVRNDASSDPDRDGLANLDEYKRKTNPRKSDTDSDGMPDGWEVANGLNPRANDSAADSDRDGLTNLVEYGRGTNARNTDSDADGMPDGWEVANGLNPLRNDASSDADRDGLANIKEYQKRTNPKNADSDADGMPDGWEVTYNFNPLSNDSSGDPDADLVSNVDEYIAGTNPRVMPGEFTVGESGVVSIDWMYDGGFYEGELGIFRTSGMKAFLSSPEAFIEEAVRRALSNTTEGYRVLSDPTEGARLDGSLGESRNRNSGPYNGIRELSMIPGDTFAIILVPNSTLEILRRHPATTNTDIRPLFSIALSNLDYGMHVGQVADVNGEGEGFVFEDQDFENGDMDYNDLILQITGAIAEIPSIDSVLAEYGNNDSRQARRKRYDIPMLSDVSPPTFNWHDWRTSEELGRQIMEHIEIPPVQSDTLWISVVAEGPADLMVYDPEGRVIGKEGGYIPGALFKMDENGQQTVTLPALAHGIYRIMLRCKGDGGTGFVTVTGHQGEAEIVSEMTARFEIDAHQLLKTTVSATAFLDDRIITFEDPEIPSTPAGQPLFYDFDGNGAIGDEDIAAVTSRWNIEEGHPDYDPFYDLDGDGYIGILDIMPVVNSR